VGAGTAIGPGAGELDVVAQLDRIPAACRRLPTWRFDARELADGCTVCRTPPGGAPCVCARRDADARARDRRDDSRVRHRSPARLRPASVRECRQRRHLLDGRRMDRGRVPVHAGQVGRLPQRRDISSERCHAPRWGRADTTAHRHQHLGGAVRRARGAPAHGPRVPARR
jgi:hypothetical protein